MSPRPALAIAVSVLLGTLLAACGSGSAAPAGSGDASLPVEMHVRWEVAEAFPATLSVHEPPPGQDVYEVHTYAEGETPDVGEEIPGGILRADYGEPRRFVALLQNHADEPVRFWVAPHLPTPHLAEQHLMMFCLCTGEVYEVPARGSWTRVMEFGVSRRAGLESPLVLTHVIVRGEIAPPTPVAGE